MKNLEQPEGEKIISSDIVAEVGRALYGQQWHLPLAKKLKVHDRTLRRWINDGCPAKLGPAMFKILDGRRSDIEKAIQSLEESGMAVEKEPG